MEPPAHGADPVVVRCLGCRAAVDRTLADACPFCGRDISAMPRIQPDAPDPEPSLRRAGSKGALLPRSPRVARVLATLALLAAVLAPDVSPQRVIGSGVAPPPEPIAAAPRRAKPVVDRVRLASVIRRGPVRVPSGGKRPAPAVAPAPSQPRAGENRRRSRDGGAGGPQARPPRADPPPPPRNDPPPPPQDPPRAEDHEPPPHGRGHGKGPGADHEDNGRGDERGRGDR